MRGAVAVLLGVLLFPAAWAGAQDQAPTAEPPEYHLGTADDVPPPATLRGARVVSTAEAHALWVEKSAAFIDVMPRPPRPEGLPETAIWRPRPRLDIPGSLWLPNTGFGALAPATAAYLAAGLQQASGGDPGRPLLFYCMAACWMSWNAAKRALALGYTAVIWYPDGADGWRDAGYTLDRREPMAAAGQ